MDPGWLSNAYLVADRAGGTAVFVDSGAPVEPLLAAVERLEVQVTHLLTTHAHSDHIANHRLLRDRFGLPVLASPEEGVDGADPLGHGEVVEPGDLRIEALRTPGHTRGMLAFVANGEACFTGDTLFAGAVGGTGDAFPDLRSSIMDVLMGLPHSVAVYPGHSEETTIGRDGTRTPSSASGAGSSRKATSRVASGARRRRSSSGGRTTTGAARPGCASATAGTRSSGARAWSGARE